MDYGRDHGLFSEILSIWLGGLAGQWVGGLVGWWVGGSMGRW